MAGAVLLGAGGAGYALRDRIGDLLAGDEPTRRPSPGPPITPSPSPEPSPEPEKKRGRLIIHGTGDVSLDPSYIPAFQSTGYGHAWSGLGGLFEEDDLTVINLECAVSTLGTAVPKKFNFRCDPEALPAARDAGVEVANLGNNHAYDFGPDALVDSRINLRRNRIAPVGAGRDDRQALVPARFTIKGWKVAVLGFGQVVDPEGSVAAPGHPGIAAGHDTGPMIRAIRKADRRADLVIVTTHWGVELDTEPRPEQVELGHRFIRAGADVIFGHHSHRLQPVDHYRGRPIFWGLGNFVWPMISTEGSTTAVARVLVRSNGKIQGRLLPAFIESHGHPVLTG